MGPTEQPRLILAEGEAQFALWVWALLEQNRLTVSVETQGDQVEHRILSEKPDGLILNMALPGLSGLELLRHIRTSYVGPIMMLTARDVELDEIVAFESGADDFIVRPLRPRVLVARIRALLRRYQNDPTWKACPTIGRQELGHLAIDRFNRRVLLNQREINLTTAEFELLWFLGCNRGQVVTRDRIFSEVLGATYDGRDRSVDLRIARLRKKLGDNGKSPQLIKSIRGAGYLMVRQL